MQPHVCKYIHLPAIYLLDTNGQLNYLSPREINSSVIFINSLHLYVLNIYLKKIIYNAKYALHGIREHPAKGSPVNPG